MHRHGHHVAHGVADAEQLIAFAGFGQNHRCVWDWGGCCSAAHRFMHKNGHPMGVRFSAMDPDADALLEHLLDSLLNDFSHWFQRGEELLAVCPDLVMAPQERAQMADRLAEGRKAIAATRALVEASPQAMAVSMEAMAPWHQLVMEVWALAARISQAAR